jgi:hypothetical protein
MPAFLYLESLIAFDTFGHPLFRMQQRVIRITFPDPLP